MKAAHLAIFVPLFLAVTLTYLPNYWIYVFLLADSFTPWSLFESKLFAAYHDFLLSRMPVRPELKIPEIHANNFTLDDILRLSKGYTVPVIIRELLINSTSVAHWKNPNWWIENYGEEQILCGTFDNPRPSCTIKDFFDEVANNQPFYVSGASKIFARNPDLAAMIEDPRIPIFEPGQRMASQIFMGLKNMGSDIHSAIGINIFRMITGSKKWWFIPPSQTAYLKPSMNVNGFSAHTHTLVGKNGGKESEWMNKLERYTAVVNPGDVLINPPWYWHGILNLAETSQDLVIGCPTRYQGRTGVIAAFKSNPMMTVNAFAIIFKNFILNGFQSSGDLEDKIKGNRVGRMKN